MHLHVWEKEKDWFLSSWVSTKCTKAFFLVYWQNVITCARTGVLSCSKSRWFWVSPERSVLRQREDGAAWQAAHRRAKLRKSAKKWIKKLVKLTGQTFAWNDLTSFECKVRTITGNGNDWNKLKLAEESSWKWDDNKLHYFVTDSTHLEPLCSLGWAVKTKKKKNFSHIAKVLILTLSLSLSKLRRRWREIC